jgi:hypothetical protein
MFASFRRSRRSLTVSGVAQLRFDANVERFARTAAHVSFHRSRLQASCSNSADIVRDLSLDSRVAARLLHRQSKPLTGGFA